MSSPFEVMYHVITPIFLVVGAAALVGSRFDPDARTISTLVIYLFNPCLIVQGIATSDLRGDEIMRIMGAIVLLSAAMIPVGYGFSRFYKLDRREESAFMLTAVLMNAANYGIPFNTFAFGEEGRTRAIMVYLASAILSNTVGVYLASRGHLSSKQALVNVFRVPLPYAAALGFYLKLSGQGLPETLGRSVDLLADATVPCMLVLLGFQLVRLSFRERVQPVLAAASARLLISPLIAVLLTALLGLSGVTRDVVIVQAGMPSAVLSGALAAEFGSDAKFATATILLSTLGSIITLSILVSLL